MPISCTSFVTNGRSDIVKFLKCNLLFNRLQWHTCKRLIFFHIEIEQNWIKNKPALFLSLNVKTICTFKWNEHFRNACIQKMIMYLQGEKSVFATMFDKYFLNGKRTICEGFKTSIQLKNYWNNFDYQKEKKNSVNSYKDILWSKYLPITSCCYFSYSKLSLFNYLILTKLTP